MIFELNIVDYALHILANSLEAYKAQSPWALCVLRRKSAIFGIFSEKKYAIFGKIHYLCTIKPLNSYLVYTKDMRKEGDTLLVPVFMSMFL